jgi:hypothetical protein
MSFVEWLFGEWSFGEPTSNLRNTKTCFNSEIRIETLRIRGIEIELKWDKPNAVPITKQKANQMKMSENWY